MAADVAYRDRADMIGATQRWGPAAGMTVATTAPDAPVFKARPKRADDEDTGPMSDEAQGLLSGITGITDTWNGVVNSVPLSAEDRQKFSEFGEE